MISKKFNEKRVRLRGSGETEILVFSLSRDDVPCLVQVYISYEGLPGKIILRVQRAAREEVAVKEISTAQRCMVLLREPGDYRVSLENVEGFEQTIVYAIELTKTERALAAEYYAIKRLGPRTVLVTDGERLLVLKSLERIWHYIRGEGFSGLLAWLFLCSLPNMRVPRLLCFNAEQKYILYEFIEGEPLDTLVQGYGKRQSVVRILTALRDAAAILDIASTHGILHRDLKPQHIILSGEKTYIIDWELACRLKDCKFPVGLAIYASPEALAGKYHERSDVCSFAKLMSISLGIWHVLEGGTVVQATEAGFEIPRAALEEIKSLIKLAVSERPEDRPSFKELYEGLDRAIKACLETET